LSAAEFGKIEILRYLNQTVDDSVKHSLDKNNLSALVLAASFANKETVQFLIEELNFDQNKYYPIGYFYLFAAIGGKTDTLRYLNRTVNYSVKRARFRDNHSALTLASLAGHKETVQYLIEELKFDPADSGSKGRNTFLSAAANGKIEILRYLNTTVDDSVKQARDDYNNSALTLAAYSGNKGTVQFLIEELNFNPAATESHGRNAFLIAAIGHKLKTPGFSDTKIETLRYLNSILDDSVKKARDDNNNTALTLAARLGNKKTVQFFIEELNADPSDEGALGRNAFLAAAEGGKVDTLRYLNKIVDDSVKQARDDYNNSALTVAAICGNKESVQVLIEEFNFNPASAEYKGRNAFLNAASTGKIETVCYLNEIIDDAVKQARDINNNSALILAARSGNKETVQYLIEELKFNPADSGYAGGNTFLHAAASGKIETLRYLNEIVGNAVKQARDDQNDSALTLAARYGNKETVKFLIEDLNFDPAYTGYNGRNAFLKAAEGGKIEILRYLNERVDDAVKQVRDDDNESATTLARLAGHEEIVQFLIHSIGNTRDE